MSCVAGKLGNSCRGCNYCRYVPNCNPYELTNECKIYFTKPSIYRDDNYIRTASNGEKMNEPKQASESKIITGLRLSEAIKYCEENPGTSLRNDIDDEGPFYPPEAICMQVEHTYSVKLPPPKSVSVTRASAELAREKAESQGFFSWEVFFKELGL